MQVVKVVRIQDRNKMIEYSFYDGDLQELKWMWEDIFKDPECFTGFYFSEICASNKVFVATDKGKVIGMIHLNPYTAVYDMSEENVYYIVGVCVKEEYRFKGIMREMMQRVMLYMKEQGMKFTFLMPKDEAYYKGLGFENIYTNMDIKYNKLVRSNNEQGIELSDISGYSEIELADLAKKMNSLIREKYLFYSKRDVLYLQRLISEHRCQSGSVIEVNFDEEFLGYFSYDIYPSDDGRYNNMFVERFCIIKNDYILAVLDCIKEIAIKNNCMTLNVSVPFLGNSEDLQWKNILIENEEGNIKFFKGKGIMAYCFSGQNELDFMKMKSFFDEIV